LHYIYKQLQNKSTSEFIMAAYIDYDKFCLRKLLENWGEMVDFFDV